MALSVGGCSCAHANAPTVVVPPTRTSRDTSSTSTGRGEVELGLGVVTTAVAVALVGVGGYEAWRGARVRSYCRGPYPVADASFEAFCLTPLGGDPFVSAVVSSTLSFAFAVPIAAAGGLLLRRGVSLRQAWRRSQGDKKMSLQPWRMGQHGAGLSLGLRF